MQDVQHQHADAPPIRTNPHGRDWTVIITVGMVASSTVIASFTALAGLGALAGWTKIFDVFGAELPMSWLVPLSVDAYGVGAARISTNKARYSAEVRQHAFWHALAAVLVSVLGNAVYHLIEAKVIVLGTSAWVLIVAVSVIPPIALGGLVHLLGMIGRTDVPGDVPAEVRPTAAVPAAVPTVLLPSGVAPAPSALNDHDVWAELSRDLHLPADEPGPYPAGYAPAPSVPADEQPHLGAGPEWSAAVPDRSGSVVATGQQQVIPVLVDVPEPREVFLKAVQTFAPGGELAEVPPIQTIKRELSCGQPRAQEVKAYLTKLATREAPAPARTRHQVSA